MQGPQSIQYLRISLLNETEEHLYKFGEGIFSTISNYASDYTLDEFENNVIELMAKLFTPVEKDKNTNENNDNKKTF